MQYYELSIILEFLEYNTKQEWERTRFNSYIIAQTQSTKRLKPTDLLTFQWDKKEDNNKNTKVSQEDIDRMTKKMNDIINKK